MNWNLNFLIQFPIYQALLFLVITPILILTIRPKNAEKAWFIALTFFTFYLILNSVMLWFSENPWHYFFYSIGFSVVYLLFIVLIMNILMKLLRLEVAGESAMGFLIFIYQPFTLLFVLFLKWILT